MWKMGPPQTPVIGSFPYFRQKNATSRTPSHFAYNVRNREGGDNYWIRIGSAWAKADGNGLKSLIENYKAFLR